MPLAERAYPRRSAHCQVGPKVTQAGCAMPRHRQTSSRQAGSASSTPSPKLLDELARKPGVELLGGRFTGQRKVRSLLPASRPPAQMRAWIRVFEPCHWQGGGQRSSRPVAWRHASGGRTTSDPLVRHQSLAVKMEPCRGPWRTCVNGGHHQVIHHLSQLGAGCDGFAPAVRVPVAWRTRNDRPVVASWMLSLAGYLRDVPRHRGDRLPSTTMTQQTRRNFPDLSGSGK